MNLPSSEFRLRYLALVVSCYAALSAIAQNAENAPPRRDADRPPPGERPASLGAANFEEPPPGGFGSSGPGRGGFGMMGQETKLVKQFDKDGDKRLNAAE